MRLLAGGANGIPERIVDVARSASAWRAARLSLPLRQRTAVGRRPTGSRSSGLMCRRCANQGTSLRPVRDPRHPPSRMRKTRIDPTRLYHSTNPPFPGEGKTRFAVLERRVGRMMLFWFSPKRLNHFANSELDSDSCLWISVTGRRSPMLQKNLFFIFRGQSSEQFGDDFA
jgi:hypothetical protein